MAERYDNSAARHYAAFRPPLHGLILGRLIRPGESFRAGLDVGCGTGYSSVALAPYCDRVVGVDPSPSMLGVAQEHPKVTYLKGVGDALSGLPVKGFDVVTFAGSLFYAKTDRLRGELARVCTSGGVILVYDFEVQLGEVLAELGVPCPAAVSDYDHRANLLAWGEFTVENRGNERLRLDVGGPDMAHLLLSDSNRYDAIAGWLRRGDPFDVVVQRLENVPVKPQLDADIYFTRYRIHGS